MKNISLILRKSFLALKILIAAGVLILFVIFIPDFCEEVKEPDKILAHYKIGSKLETLALKDQDIVYKLKPDKANGNLNIILGGYEHPKKYLDENQGVVMVDEGDYIVYLYFDKEEVLIGKEIVGS